MADRRAPWPPRGPETWPEIDLSDLLETSQAGFAPAQYWLGRTLLDFAAAGTERPAIASRFADLPAASAPDDVAQGRALIAKAARRDPAAAGWWALHRTPIPASGDERPVAHVLRGLAALARPTPDRPEALRWLGRAARLRDPAGLYWLAMALREERGEAMPEAVAAEAAHQALRTAAEAGHLEAMTQWGLDRLAAGDVQAGLDWLTRAAERGDAWAQYRLGLAYHRGVEVPWHPTLALLWLGRAAEADNLHAAAYVEALAPLVPPGEAPPSDAAWFGFACEAGEMESVGALALMAICLEGGLGTARDERLAMDLWLRAARGGERRALAHLAEGYRQALDEADGSIEAHERALALYEVLRGFDHAAAIEAFAARFGDLPAAQLALARRCEAGRGGQADPRRAAGWYQRVQANMEAAPEMRRLALLRLARLGRAGVAVAIDPDTIWREAAEDLVAAACGAFIHWSEAADASPALAVAIAPTARALRTLAESNDDAAFQLAYLASRGLGVPHDPAYAEAVMAGAVRRGHPGATGLTAVMARDRADLARVAHFENDGPDPAPFERKAEQALAAAVELAERLYDDGGLAPPALTGPLAVAWRLAAERLATLGEDVPRVRMQAPHLAVEPDREGSDARIRVWPEGRPELYAGEDAETCVPDLMSVGRYGALLSPAVAAAVRELPPDRAAEVATLGCLEIAAAMGRPAASERARMRALGMTVAEVAAARSLATAWWRRREELGDFADLHVSPAWQAASAVG